ncbi:MAG: hypothetical protein QNK64_08740 [Saprospiraceae bacterium]|jgi:hypothetical protein|nr:hypothetical protein [Saprospiraceae bacterium]MDB4162961.1 hypothetical protein [Saprospiraceae bacterium]
MVNLVNAWGHIKFLAIPIYLLISFLRCDKANMGGSSDALWLDIGHDKDMDAIR